MIAELRVIGLDGVPEIAAGVDLANVVDDALMASDVALIDGDVGGLAQKIVSKAEARLVDLTTVQPSSRAQDLAQATAKDPRLVELILQESNAVLRTRTNLIVVEHRLGFVLANAGIDQSNVGAKGDYALLLPENPDRTCAQLRSELTKRHGVDVAVMIIDSMGRAWRHGTVGHALGLAGLPGVLDLRGQKDRNGRSLQSSELGLADEVAAASSLVMGQAAEGRPIVIARGVPYARGAGTAAELLRPRA